MKQEYKKPGRFGLLCFSASERNLLGRFNAKALAGQWSYYIVFLAACCVPLLYLFRSAPVQFKLSNIENLEVNANSYWRHTFLIASPGDEVDVNYVSGQWSSGAEWLGPEGMPRFNQACPLPTAPAGSLIMRIGKSTFYVGRKLRLIVPAGVTGEICFGINEALYNASRGDNSGSVTVNLFLKTK